MELQISGNTPPIPEDEDELEEEEDSEEEEEEVSEDDLLELKGVNDSDTFGVFT